VEVPLTAAGQEGPVLGCHPVDCHYIEDKLRARARADATNLMLKDFGLEPERFRLGPRLAKGRALPKR
jgi:coenzyme F420-reducing hydrogenase delta subunit